VLVALRGDRDPWDALHHAVRTRGFIQSPTGALPSKAPDRSTGPLGAQKRVLKKVVVSIHRGPDRAVTGRLRAKFFSNRHRIDFAKDALGGGETLAKCVFNEIRIYFARGWSGLAIRVPVT